MEDSPHDRELITMALEKCRLVNPIVTVNDGEEALDYLFRRAAWKDVRDDLPAFVLLDKKLPKVDGHEVLAAIRADKRTAYLPVLMLTSSKHEADLLKSYEMGVNAYVVKPIQYQEFMEAVKDIGMFWAVLNEQPPHTVRAEGEPMVVTSINTTTGKVVTDRRGG
ncbi:CheY-like chemotaxis protein [Robbsia andropogonis]